MCWARRETELEVLSKRIAHESSDCCKLEDFNSYGLQANRVLLAQEFGR